MTKKINRNIGRYKFTQLDTIAVFIIAAPFIIKILTAGRFTEAYNYARILSLSNVTAGIYYAISNVIVAHGYPNITLLAKIIGSIISIFLFKFLISNFEFYGAAWGQVLSFLGMTIVCLIMLFIKQRKRKKQ